MQSTRIITKGAIHEEYGTCTASIWRGKDDFSIRPASLSAPSTPAPCSPMPTHMLITISQEGTGKSHLVDESSPHCVVKQDSFYDRTVHTEAVSGRETYRAKNTQRIVEERHVGIQRRPHYPCTHRYCSREGMAETDVPSSKSLSPS